MKALIIAVLVALLATAGWSQVAADSDGGVRVAATVPVYADGQWVWLFPSTWGWKTWTGIATTTVLTLYGFDAFGMQSWLSHNTKDGDGKTDDPATPTTPPVPTVAGGDGSTVVVVTGTGNDVDVIVNSGDTGATAQWYLRPDLTDARALLYARLGEGMPREESMYVCQR